MLGVGLGFSSGTSRSSPGLGAETWENIPFPKGPGSFSSFSLVFRGVVPSFRNILGRKEEMFQLESAW